MTVDPVKLTATEIARRVREKSLSARDVTKAFLDRAKAWDPKVKAFLAILEEPALAQAAAVDDRVVVPVTALANHPNPFNPSTRISFALPNATKVKLSAYSLDGRLVAGRHLTTHLEGHRRDHHEISRAPDGCTTADSPGASSVVASPSTTTGRRPSSTTA